MTGAPLGIDVLLKGRPRLMCAYLLPGDEPAIVDPGPASSIPALEAGLAGHGLALEDVRHLLLTHVHLDHAGAAGTLVRRHAGLLVHVSEVGAPHLLDPSRLERSARRIWENFDELWGELAPVPQENLRVAGGRVLDLDVFPTPGHAAHHVTYVGPDGSCYTGDVAGARIAPDRLVVPVTPPPDVDLAAFESSLAAIEGRRPERLCLPHFGIAEDLSDHFEDHRELLARWAERVEAGATEDEFVAAVEAEIRAHTDPETAECLAWCASPRLSYLGLRRYWDKQAEAARG